jgi:hypothetical protein
MPLRGNPRFFQCMLDEDMIRRAHWILTLLKVLNMFVFRSPNLVSKNNQKTTRTLKNNILYPTWCFKLGFKQQPQVKAICKGLHPRVFSQRALEHYCIAVTLRWSGVCWGKKLEGAQLRVSQGDGLHTIDFDPAWGLQDCPNDFPPAYMNGYIRKWYWMCVCMCYIYVCMCYIYIYVHKYKNIWIAYAYKLL